MRGLILIVFVVAFGVALAWQSVPRLFVNGKPGTIGAIQSGGKLYVSIDDLKSAGAEVTQSAGRLSIQFKPMQDRLQVNAVEGVIGEWIQNERFRVRVLEVKPGRNPFGNGPGFVLKIEVRNLGSNSVNFGTSGSPDLQLIDTKGNVMKVGSRSFKDLYTALAPGNGFVNDLEFGDPSNKLSTVESADKLLILFKSSGGKKLKDLRIDLRNP